MRLTDDAIRKAKRPTSGQQFLWDDLLQGFGVRLTPTKSSYVVTWRERSSGKRPRETLRGARVGLDTVAVARDLARKRLSEVLGSVEHGAGVPLRQAMRSWFTRQVELDAWRPRYRMKVDSLIAAYVEGEPNERIKLPSSTHAAIDELGSKAVAAVTRTDVLRVTDALKPGAAEQFMAILSSYFGAAYEREIVTGNPARNRLRVLGGRSVRSRTPSDAEFLKLWRAFEVEGDPHLGAFTLLSYTGARRREVTGMRWEELNLDAATWTLQPERRKTGKHDREPFIVTLHPDAVATIRRQPQLQGSPFVFWGRRDKSQFDFQHSLMDRMRPLVKDFRLHDLRRYMRSGMARLGVPQAVAEQCLGHLPGGLVAVYDQHNYASEKAAAWIRWGDHLRALIASKPA